MAFARFRGLALPTIHHWARAAQAPFDAFFAVTPSVAAISRLSSKFPIAANPGVGLGPWGTVNSAGNVREWVWNFTGTRAFALGAAWNDYSTVAISATAVQPLDRSPQNGLRLMQPLDAAPIATDLLAPIDLALDHAVPLKPVSDLEFESMRTQFTFVARAPSHVETTTVAKNEPKRA